MYEPDKIPWLIPMPTKQAGFKSLNQDSECIITAPEKMLTFKFQSSPFQSSELLWSDLQSTFTSPSGRILGSARSGFYKNNYLKGVGLTNLAGHWHTASDSYHCSGHMLASAAVREFLITQIAKAKGLEDLIVPCNNIFLKDIESQELEYVNSTSFGGTEPYLIDKHMFAISSKKGMFSRHSNLSWFLSNNYFHQDQNFFEELARILEIAFDVEQKIFLRDFDQAINTLLNGIIRGFGNILFCNLNGIYWNSLHNNYTCDGRFLDLEVASYLGGYCIGEQTRDNDPQALDGKVGPPYKLGFEAIIQLKHSRFFFKSLLSWIEFHFSVLKKTKRFRNSEFYSSHFEIHKHFKERILSNIIFNDKKLHLFFLDMIITNIDLPKKELDQIKNDIQLAFDFFLYRKSKYTVGEYPSYDVGKVVTMAYPCEHSENQKYKIPKNLQNLLINNEEELSFVRDSFYNIVNSTDSSKTLKLLREFETSSRYKIKPAIKNKKLINDICN